MSGVIYSNLVKITAGAIVGASTIRSWSSPLLGALAGAKLIVHPNPHHVLISAAAFSTIGQMLERYVWDQRIFSVGLSLVSISIINGELAKEISPIMDVTTVGYYLPSLIDVMARYHLGQAVLAGSVLLTILLATTRSTLHSSKPIDEEKYQITDAELKRAKVYLDAPEKLIELPGPIFGKLDVRFLDDLVLKRSDKPDIWVRASKMKQAQQICADNGYEDLVVPRARTYRSHFQVESKLPITLPRIKDQVGLYHTHRDLFTNAVKEFTGLLFQAPIEATTGYPEDPCVHVSQSPMGRYDNVCLYVENGRGKIGLVDLERLQSKDISVEKVPLQKIESPLIDLKRKLYRGLYWILGLTIKKPEQMAQLRPSHETVWEVNCTEVCLDLIYLFPLHFEEILSTADKFAPISAALRKELETVRDRVLTKHKLIYGNHLQFIHANGITLEKPDMIVNPPVEQIRQNLEEKVGNLLGEGSDGVIGRFNEEVFPELLTGTLDLIEAGVKKTNQEHPPGSIAQLLTNRSVTLDKKALESLCRTIGPKLKMFHFSEGTTGYGFAENLIRYLLDALVQTKVLAYYDGRGYIFC